MIIFIEGPDGSGKSTLAKNLSRDMGWPVKSFSWPKSEKEKEQMFLMYKRFIRSDKNIIVDRGWWSEMIYGPIKRDKSYITAEQMLELEADLMTVQGGMIIHCTAPAHVLESRLQARGDDYIDVYDVNFIANVKLGYEHLMHDVVHNLPVVRYEYNPSLPTL